MMLEEKNSETALIEAFAAAAPSPSVAARGQSLAETRLDILDHFLRFSAATDEFDMAASVIAGKILGRDAADAFVDTMSDREADIFTVLTQSVDLSSPRDRIVGVMAEEGLLPDFEIRRPAREQGLEFHI